MSTTADNSSDDGIVDGESTDHDSTSRRSSSDSDIQLTDDDDPRPKSLDLEINHAKEAFKCLIENDYTKGFAMFSQYSNHSLYHLLGKICCLVALNITNFKKSSVARTLNEIRAGYKLIGHHRKKTSWWGNDYDSYTDVQCHAELIYAEVLALESVLTVIHDQSLSGLICAGYKVRSAHRTFKECERVLQGKTNWHSSTSRDHFSSGVNFSLGSFEMVISHFPSRFVRILEFAGFCGDKKTALRHFNEAEAIRHGFMHPWVSVLLSFHQGFLEYLYGLAEPDLDCLKRIHNFYTIEAPKGIAVNFGAAFFAAVNGDFDSAFRHYQDFIEGQSLIKTFHNISYWQQMWLRAADSNWSEAAQMAKAMVDSSWRISPALVCYIYACFLQMRLDEETDLDEAERNDLEGQVTHYLSEVPRLKRNFGGKRAFHEKLVMNKSKQFESDRKSFTLPALDIMYIWNGYTIAAYKDGCIDKLVNMIERRLKVTDEEDVEATSRLTFMKGVCLSKTEPMRALEYFKEVLRHEKALRGHSESSGHLAPQSCFEIGLIYRKSCQTAKAKKWLNKTWKYSGYMTESMITFRVDLALQSME